MATLAICRKKFIPLIALVFFFIMANFAFAETNVFKDQVFILTFVIVTAEIMEGKWDSNTYYPQAKITADPKDVVNSIENLRQDHQKTKELEKTRMKADAALREGEKLKNDLAKAKIGKKEQDQYKKTTNGLSAIDWFEKGNALITAGKYKEGVEAYTSAIELDPKYVDAFIFRGIAYRALGDNRQAIKDFGKAIEMDPKYTKAYVNRGDSYGELGDHRQAIKDYDKAIQVDTKLAPAYYNRGIAYGKLGNHQQKIEDFKIAARLGDKEAQDCLRANGISW